MIENRYFAAFIMTYCRVDTLQDTINKLLQQSVPPQKILIVDNDPAKSAEILSTKFSHLPIEYYSVGYNSGPAGAAKIGLDILSREGYKWIAWMDDDDPPIFKDTFEILLNMAASDKKCGCVGVVGQRFNKKNGLMVRIPDNEIEGKGVLEVDNIAGNMCKIVNTKVVSESKVYPDESLFFGFEELDFDLRIQRAGYILLADKTVYKKHRLHYNRVGINVKRGAKKDKHKMWRDYYSIRNGLIICRKNRLYTAFLYTFFRAIAKSIIAFSYGVSYGFQYVTIVSKAVFHYFIGKKRKIDFS